MAIRLIWESLYTNVRAHCTLIGIDQLGDQPWKDRVRVKTDDGDVLSIEVGDCVLHNDPDTTLDRDNQYLRMRLVHAGRAVELT